MLRNLFLSLLAIVCLFGIACQKDLRNKEPIPDSDTIPTPNIPWNEPTGTVSLQGRVYDESGKPSGGTRVSVGNSTTTTDQYGIFRFEKIQSKLPFSYIKVEQQGYFDASRTVAIENNGRSFVQIQLIRKKMAGQVSSSEAGQVAVSGVGTIKFQANSFTTKSGAPFTGNVKVYAEALNPDSRDFGQQMPGTLIGIREDSSISAMKSYGMLIVRLEGSSGEELQLNADKSAEITFKIPESMRVSAPAKIPLWHFDENKGLWREEGFANRNGDHYTGEVKHFSMWNFDYPEDFVFISLTLKTEDQVILPYTAVQITDITDGSYRTEHTDSSGYLRTWVTKGSALKLQVMSECLIPLDSQMIGPYSNDAALGDVVVNKLSRVEVKGRLVNCNRQPITDGYVTVFYKGLTYKVESATGNFKVELPDCRRDTAAVYIYGVDNSTGKSCPQIFRDLIYQNIDIGDVVLCTDTQQEFAYMVLNNIRYDFPMQQEPGNISRFSDSVTTHFYFTKYPGTLRNSDAQMGIRLIDTIPLRFQNELLVAGLDNRFYYTVNNKIDINCTEYGKLGEFIAFDWTGHLYKDSVGPALPFTGAIRVRRTQ